MASDIAVGHIWRALLDCEIRTFRVQNVTEHWIAIEFVATKEELFIFCEEIQPKVARITYGWVLDRPTKHMPMYRYTVVIEETLTKGVVWPQHWKQFRPTGNPDDDLPF